MHAKMAALLNETTKELSFFCENALSSMTPKWWENLVLKKLSFNQKRSVKENGITSISGLDLAALLHVFDQNWRNISEHRNIQKPKDARIYLKEMQAIRNRWAHVGSEEFPIDDIYRDLDTLYRFAIVIEADSGFVERIKNTKSNLFINIHLKNKTSVEKKPEDVNMPILSKKKEVIIKRKTSIMGLKRSQIPKSDTSRDSNLAEAQAKVVVSKIKPGKQKAQKLQPIRRISSVDSTAKIVNSRVSTPLAKDIPRIHFIDKKTVRLRQIYGVLYFMNQGFGYTEATKETLKLFSAKDVQTIADKCARGFAGDTETFKQWYYSGEILERLNDKLGLSGHDYKIFKKLLGRCQEKVLRRKDKSHDPPITKVTKFKKKSYVSKKENKKIVNPDEVVSFRGINCRWTGSQWLNADTNVTLPGNITQQLNNEFLPVKKL